mgnify:CR=1 FL=1
MAPEAPPLDLDAVLVFLRSVATRAPDDPKVKAVEDWLKVWKAGHVAAGDSINSTLAWCLESTLEVQQKYLSAFSLLRGEEFYKAWCELERAEIRLHGLERHFLERWAEFQLGFIREHVARWQAVYPYKLFFSPEMRIRKKRCNICKQVVGIRTNCGHRTGEIYDGEYCLREVSDMEFLGTALVSSPVQKYSVPFLVDPETGNSVDHYDYSAPKFVFAGLSGPFDPWNYEWQVRRRPHSHYRDVGRNDPCPCESGSKYKKCCLKHDEGVAFPHLEIIFESLAPDSPKLTPAPVWPSSLKPLKDPWRVFRHED